MLVFVPLLYSNGLMSDMQSSLDFEVIFFGCILPIPGGFLMLLSCVFFFFYQILILNVKC